VRYPAELLGRHTGMYKTVGGKGAGRFKQNPYIPARFILPKNTAYVKKKMHEADRAGPGANTLRFCSIIRGRNSLGNDTANQYFTQS